MVNVRVSAVFMDLKLSGLQRIQEDVYSKMNFYFQLKFHAKARGVYNCLFWFHTGITDEVRDKVNKRIMYVEKTINE